MVTVCQQCVQGHAIGKRRLFGNGSIGALLMAEGITGFHIERNEIGTRYLRAGNPLDFRMKAGNRPLSPCNQADSLLIILLCRHGVLPLRRNLWIFLHKVSLKAEDEIPTCCHFWKEFLQRLMHPCLFRLPLLEEGQHGTCRRSIHSLKELLMQLLGRSEALQCIPPLFLCLCRVVLFISNAQEIGSSITEKISFGLLSCSCRMVWHNHLTRTDDRLLALTLFFSQVIDAQERSILRQIQSKGYAHRTPAAPRQIL